MTAILYKITLLTLLVLPFESTAKDLNNTDKNSDSELIKECNITNKNGCKSLKSTHFEDGKTDPKPALKGRYKKEKTIKKEFNVNATALLKISNSYGDLNLTSWDQDRVVIEVYITTSGDDEEKVTKKLEDITVNFESSISEVYAKTIFNKNKSSWKWGWGGRNNVNMRIDYNIKVPIKNSVNLKNNYGAISLDRIDGHAKIYCDYGRLELGELRGRDNYLNFDYTSKSKIGYIKSGTINADYSGFTIERAENLEINADYTNSRVIELKNLNYNCDYGSLEIENANNINGKGSYLSTSLGSLHGSADLNSSYGSIKIKELAPDAGNLHIRSDYTGIKIGYNANYHFNFEIRTEYAGVCGKEDFDIDISKVKSSEKYYKGSHGNSNNKNVSIISEYGSITFFKSKYK